MTKAEDNEFPYITLVETAAPAAPASGRQRAYIDPADHKLKRKDSSGAIAFLEGSEIAYVEFTSAVSITATTEATANSVVSAGAISFDGSTRVKIEFYAEYALAPSSVSIFLALYDGSSSIGIVGQIGNSILAPVTINRFLTPSNASHTYSVRAYVGSGTGTVNGGAGGSGNVIPGYIRITRA